MGHIPNAVDVIKHNSTVTCGTDLMLLDHQKQLHSDLGYIPNAVDIIKNNSTVTYDTYLMLLTSSNTTPQ